VVISISPAGPDGVVLDGVAFLGRKHYRDRTMEGVLDNLRREEDDRMLLREDAGMGPQSSLYGQHSLHGQQNVLVNNFVNNNSSNSNSGAVGQAVQAIHTGQTAAHVHSAAHAHSALAQSKLRSAAGERLLQASDEKNGLRKDNNSVQLYIDVLEEQVGMVWAKVEEMRKRHSQEFEWEMLKAFKNGKSTSQTEKQASLNSGGSNNSAGNINDNRNTAHSSLNPLQSPTGANANSPTVASPGNNQNSSSALIPSRDQLGRPSLMYLLHSVVNQVQSFQREVDYCFEHIKLLEDWRLKYEFTMMQKAHGWPRSGN
jgi:hypothetical protein